MPDQDFSLYTKDDMDGVNGGLHDGDHDGLDTDHDGGDHHDGDDMMAENQSDYNDANADLMNNGINGGGAGGELPANVQMDRYKKKRLTRFRHRKPISNSDESTGSAGNSGHTVYSAYLGSRESFRVPSQYSDSGGYTSRARRRRVRRLN